MLNNFFIILLILISFTKFAFGNEPTDIWSLEKKEKDSEENTVIDDSSNEIKNKKIKINAGITNDVKVLEENFTKKNNLVVGIYDPGKYGFELDMWNKSDGKKIYELKKKINSMNLSDDASEIYKKILLTNTFPPKNNKGLNHGEAVLLGIMSAVEFSRQINILKKNDYEKIIEHLKELDYSNLNKYFKSKDISKIIFYMKQDKKNKDSKINLILLKSIAKPTINKSFEENKIRLFLKNLIY